MITNSGLNLTRDLLNGDTVNTPSHIAIGTGTTSPKATDTALETEVLRKAISAKSKPATGQVLFEITVGTTEANGYNLTEVGLFNSSSGGTMVSRVVHPAINKTSDFSLKYQIIIITERP